MIRARRSLLFMPGSNQRAHDKGRNLPADGLILDLEDSVAPEAKALARDQIARSIATGGFGRREILIRSNGLDTPWWADDLAMAGQARPDGILVPKVSSAADLKVIADTLSDLGADPAIRVWAMIETARAVLHAEELAAASRDGNLRLAGFVFGPNDISRETRIRMLPGRAAMIPMITHCILAARAHGLEILDGPYSDFGNVNGFAAVTNVAGYVQVYGNPALTNLNGFAALQSIGTTLTVSANSVLTSITGLIYPTGALTQLGGAMTIQSNAQLSVCQTTALKAALGSSWTGTFNNSSNLACSGTCNGATCQ